MEIAGWFYQEIHGSEGVDSFRSYTLKENGCANAQRLSPAPPLLVGTRKTFFSQSQQRNVESTIAFFALSHSYLLVLLARNGSTFPLAEADQQFRKIDFPSFLLLCNFMAM
jgi:hypothetical protein